MWVYGKLTYHISKQTKELVAPVKKTIRLEHSFIGKKLKNGYVISTITSDKTSHIQKTPIKNIPFYDFIKNQKHDVIKYMSRPVYFTEEQFDKYFTYDKGISLMQDMLKLDQESTKDFLKNLTLNFRSMFNLLKNEEIIDVIAVEEKENSIELKVKTKTVLLIADEASNVYIEKYVEVGEENLDSLHTLFKDLGIGGEDLLVDSWIGEDN